MPVLDVSELNVVLGVLSKSQILCPSILLTESFTDDKPTVPGAFILLYGVISMKIKAKWYLGEART
jgi:hypothetical protein